MQRPRCEAGIPDYLVCKSVHCRDCSKLHRECAEWLHGLTYNGADVVYCAHCGKLCVDTTYRAGAGERVCEDCAFEVTAPKNNTQEGKPRLSLLPMDVLEKYLVPAYEEGVKKYNRESWRGGFHTSVMVDAALRHIMEFYWAGKDVDPDSEVGKHPLAGAIFSLLSLLHTLDTRPELDDRPSVTTTKNYPVAN